MISRDLYTLFRTERKKDPVLKVLQVVFGEIIYKKERERIKSSLEVNGKPFYAGINNLCQND